MIIRKMSHRDKMLVEKISLAEQRAVGTQRFDYAQRPHQTHCVPTARCLV